MIHFAPPRIDQKIIDEVTSALQSGWITTGPRTKKLEKELALYCGNEVSLCLNSATAALELMLRWFGVKEGDEVIVPAYTYCATANVVMHCGAVPVFADVNPADFNISVKAIEKAITAKTKVIIPVDFAGMPCDYDQINALVKEDRIRKLFSAQTDVQKQLGRIMVLADAAHSLGAVYKGKRTGSLADASVFSFHAVKNLTTAEGGAIAFNLPAPLSNQQLYESLCIKSLHGQNKDALAKAQKGNWRYDIIEAGYKCNMTDIAAAMGLVELERYEADTLVVRKHIFDMYSDLLKKYEWAEIPVYNTDVKQSSFHVYSLRIKGIDEPMRDAIIQEVFLRDVSVNVHFIPVPMMSYYKKLGYDIKKFPIAYDNYSREISLPVFYDLTDDDINTVANAVISSYQKVVEKVTP